MNSLKASCVLRLATLFAAVAPGGASAEESLNLTFGVYTSDKPTDMYRAYKPALVYLESFLATELSKPVQVKLRVFNSYDSARDALVAEEVDFVRFGPSSYILAKDRNAGVQLLVIEEQEGQFLFKGVIFTRTDSGINSIKDLKGKSFAFGDPDSTIGRYLSQSFLVSAGIHQKDLSKHEYLERHDRVVDAVLSGKFDAGAAKEGTFAKFKDKGLKVLETFDNITKPWVGRSKLDGKVSAAIRKGLVTLKDKKVLDAMGEKITGFNADAAKDEMYEPVRQGMKKAEEFVKGAKPVPVDAPQPGN